MKKVMSLLMTVAMLAMMCSTVFGFSGIEPTVTAPNGANDTASTIIGVMQWFGYAIAIGMLVFIGIKYVMASANEKADLKNALIRYVIGAVLIVFAVTIAGWVFSLNGGGAAKGNVC